MLEFTLSDRTESEHGLRHNSPAVPLEDCEIPLLPWIQSPIENELKGDDRLGLRHESNTLELFFDLFLIANLATFTAKHSITSLDTLVAYIGLFGILWSTWFQITLHDVRFSLDSVYERVCKIVQFVFFVGFALVGSSFLPGSKKENNANYRALCGILFASRLLLATQYAIALFLARRVTRQLTVPLSLTVATYILCAGAFYSMSPAFSTSSGNGTGIYYMWYVIIAVEAAVVIGISCMWRRLGFKNTHLKERMGLLTLIVIGEGVIGVSKTVGRLMGNTGLTVEGCGLVLCIVLILGFLWALYFDNHPEHHYGTIREQFWAALHFPLHLAIVGLVEGSQQIANARYVFKEFISIEDAIQRYCLVENLDGIELRDSIWETISAVELESKLDSVTQMSVILEDLYSVSNITGICSPGTNADPSSSYALPDAFHQVMVDILGGLFQSTGVKIPSGENPYTAARSTFITLYVYYWISLSIVILSFGAFLWMTRRNGRPAPLFDRMAMGGRTVAAIIAAGLAVAVLSRDFLYHYIRSPAILPTVTVILFAIICCDRLGRAMETEKL